MSEKLMGYKMVRPDGTSFYDSKTVYAVGKIIKIVDATTDGQPCGHGLHLSKEKHGPMKYNAVWPWRLFECSYSEKDIVGQDTDKVRVKKLTVETELDPTDIGLPRAEQFFSRLERLSKYRGMKPQTPARKKNITKALHEYVKRLNAHPAANGRIVVLNKVMFHGIVEWDSAWDSAWDPVWDSVRASVRASVWASVRASVWASVWASVRDSAWDPVRDSVWASVWDFVWASVRDSVWASVRASVWASVWDPVRDSVWASVWDFVWASVRDSVWDFVTLDDGASPFLPEHDILDYGAVLYGIDNDGVAHIIMPTKDEIAGGRA